MDLNTVTDGEYIGVCQNKILIAVVKVCVKNHEIADIEILGHKASYMEQAETIAGKVGVNLKIILKYILTNVKERKARTFVMLLSILLSAMLLFVSFSTGVSYESAQRKMRAAWRGVRLFLFRVWRAVFMQTIFPPCRTGLHQNMA